MKITKQRLKEIIREELSREGKRTDMTMPALTDDDFEPELPTYEGEPFGEYDIEAENEKGRRIKARELLAAMSKEELKDFALSLDAATVAELRHLLANPMYKEQ
mgnify:FL=1